MECHTGNPPAFHRASGFRKTHGRMAAERPTLCPQCHGPTGCRDCHGTQMPHPKDWALNHKSFGATFKKGGLCFRCHEKKFCQRCHPAEQVEGGKP